MFTAFDLRYIARELQDPLVGAIFDKAYQTSARSFLFQFHKSGQGKQLLMVHIGEALYLTHEKKTMERNSSFAMFLRKHLEQSRVVSLEQKGFERIAEITFSNGLVLVIEVFSKGNIALLENGKVLACFEEQAWRDRTVKKGVAYQYPPLKHDPFTLDTPEFQEILQSSKKESVVQSLAVDFGLSGRYAEEVCMRAGVPKKKKSIDVPKLLKQIRALGVQEIKANIVRFGDQLAVNPIEMLIYENAQKELFPSFNQALEFCYSQGEEEERKAASREKTEDLAGKQREQLAELEKKAVLYKELGDLIYTHYADLETLLEEVKKKNWNVKNNLIKELRKPERKVIVTLDGKDAALDITKNMVQNATFYYDIAKKSKRKIPNARAVLQATLKKAEIKEHKKAAQKLHRKKAWYEKFRWFKTSEGKLVIGGRDATTNDIIVKKHLDTDDIVFHTESPGSPFVVIKAEGKAISEEEKAEAAQFCATNSKAWGQKLALAEVFSVKPDQIKHQFGLPKGTFMVYGGREYYKPGLEQAVGITEDGIAMGGPVKAVKKHCKSFVVVRQGDEKKSDAAKKIRYILKAEDLNEIMQALPPGECIIVT